MPTGFHGTRMTCGYILASLAFVSVRLTGVGLSFQEVSDEPVSYSKKAQKGFFVHGVVVEPLDPWSHSILESWL